MLTKLEETVLSLLTQDDFSVHLTFARNALAKDHLNQSSSIEGAWQNYIRESIAEILHAENRYFFDMLVIKDNDVKKTSAKLKGKEIATYLFSQFALDADGVRITITGESGKKQTWIIVRP